MFVQDQGLLFVFFFIPHPPPPKSCVIQGCCIPNYIFVFKFGLRHSNKNKFHVGVKFYIKLYWLESCLSR